MGEILRHLIIVFGVLAGAMTLSAALIWVERRLLGLWQDRYGPNRVGPFGLLQVVADMIKIFFKEDWIPPFADRPVFVLAPAMVVVATLFSYAVIPFAPGIGISDLNIGLLFFLAMTSLGVYGIVLGGWSSQSKYALLGSLRATAQLLSYEVFMGLSVMGVVMMAGSFNLRTIVEAQRGLWFCIPQMLGLVIFFIAGLAETHRLPFDLPEAESELVDGYHTEYSGLKFGLFFVGEYLGITLISLMIATLFFGGWLGPVLPPIVWLLGENLCVHLSFHFAAGSPAATSLRSAHVLCMEDSSAAFFAEPAGNGGDSAGLRLIRGARLC